MQPKHFEVIDAFVYGMIERANAITHMKNELCVQDDIWLRDFRTIGYKIPRQSGSAFWLDNDFLKYSDSILIVQDSGVREALRDSYTRDLEYISFTSDAQIPDREKGLPPSVMARILTYRELHVKINDVMPFVNPDKVNRIYIRDGERFFRKVRANKFYGMLAKELNVDTTLIITQNH